MTPGRSGTPGAAARRRGRDGLPADEAVLDGVLDEFGGGFYAELLHDRIPWNATVRSVTPRISATSFIRRPSASNCTTSRCRGVSSLAGGCGAREEHAQGYTLG